MRGLNGLEAQSKPSGVNRVELVYFTSLHRGSANTSKERSLIALIGKPKLRIPAQGGAFKLANFAAAMQGLPRLGVVPCFGLLS